MNLTVFCSISRFLIRNLNVLKLQQVPVVRRSHRIRLPDTVAERVVWCDSCGNNNKGRSNKAGDDDYKNNEGDDGCNSKQKDRYGMNQFFRLGPAGMGMLVSGAFSFGFFGKSKNDDEETPEDKLITTIKRSILCIQREEYDKAEQMLHLALRMAQDIHSKEGITYIYDVMANLAMEREQFKKAEKLFADVMKRLFADGYTEDSPQILHISAKLAHMSQLQGELEKALKGFTWTLKRIEEFVRKMPNDKEIQELLGLTKNWFGQLQMKLGKYADAKKLFREAYDCLVDIYGTANEEAITILNNLSVACVNLEEFEEAKKYLMQALELVRELKDTTQEGILQANLGLIYLREGLIAQARETCKLAWRIGKESKNMDAIEQAEYCLNEIKSYVQ